MHLPDVFILKPIFYRNERIAFAGTVCHQTDMGGRVAGSNASDSTETYQEGLRIPPVKYLAEMRLTQVTKLVRRAPARQAPSTR